jgi:ribonuclease-3
MSIAPPLLEDVQQRIGYHFRNPDLLRAALKHASSADHRRDSNERMEFLGDAVLGLVVCEALFQALPDAQEGELTKIKSAVVSRAACARVATNLQLADALVLGQGMGFDGQLPKSIVAAALESVIAAVYLDGGMEAARDFVLRAMRPEIDSAVQSEHHFNYKSQLQQHAQRLFNHTPHYELLDEKGPDHAKCFEVAVSIGSQRFPGAWGPNKKEAEQKAARLALESLGVLAPEPENT